MFCRYRLENRLRLPFVLDKNLSALISRAWTLPLQI